MHAPGRRFSYANVASTLALIVAVGGSGVAVAAAMVPKNSVASKQIVNDSVQHKDVKNGTLKHADLTRGPIGITRGYAWIDDGATTVGTPVKLTNGYVYNSTGKAVRVTRHSTGSYTVNFAGLDWNPGNVQVTAYGGSGLYCSVPGWGSPTVSVACFDDTGSPANSQFTVAVLE